MQNDSIHIQGLRQNNLKNISLSIPKNKIVVFTGVSGSGKSSIVFDTIAAESQRQMNETYPPFIRSRLPKYIRPKADKIENLSASVVVDQARLGGNARSTVGTISDLYATLRVLFSRIGEPHIGTASYFSFNDTNGMCSHCSGMGKVITLDISHILNDEGSLNTDMIQVPMYRKGSWYWKKYVESGYFDPNKKWKDYSQEEKDLLLYGKNPKEGQSHISKNPKEGQSLFCLEGVFNHLERLFVNRDISDASEAMVKRKENLLTEEECPVCHGMRLNERALSCRIDGYNIAQLCGMDLVKLRDVLSHITDERGKLIVESMLETLTRMIDIGLPYLSLDRESQTLSGGEAQRVKLVRYMGSSLSGMTYIFDEPSTGMHPRDVHRMTNLLKNLRDMGNSVLVVEHDKDIISIADEVIDIGPLAGRRGGQVMFQGSYEQLLSSGTLTGNAMKEQIQLKQHPRKPLGFLPIRDASLHNLREVSVDIPLGVLTVVTGVAGSGKSTLIRDIFAKKYQEQVVLIDQSPITATNRSTPATYLGFFDDIRKLLADENGVDAGLFSFNSTGACPVCKGKGVVVTELVFMDPVTTVCEACGGGRYNDMALSYCYQNKNIVEILDMTTEEAREFFHDQLKIRKKLDALIETGLPYLLLGQPLSTLSGGERQRIKLASRIHKKGNIYVLDEPTTGLHAADVKGIIKLLEQFVEKGNTVIVIEHNIDVMKQADYIIDIGPDGGSKGGEVVFTGTPQEMMEHGETITARYLQMN